MAVTLIANSANAVDPKKPAVFLLKGTGQSIGPTAGASDNKVVGGTILLDAGSGNPINPLIGRPYISPHQLIGSVYSRRESTPVVATFTAMTALLTAGATTFNWSQGFYVDYAQELVLFLSYSGAVGSAGTSAQLQLQCSDLFTLGATTNYTTLLSTSWATHPTQPAALTTLTAAPGCQGMGLWLGGIGGYIRVGVSFTANPSGGNYALVCHLKN